MCACWEQLFGGLEVECHSNSSGIRRKQFLPFLFKETDQFGEYTSVFLMLFFLKGKERLWRYLHGIMSHESWRTYDFLRVNAFMNHDPRPNQRWEKYSFIIYWTIAQKLNITNQTTNFTILIRIWNHDFYITQKSNFCTAGHKYLNKMGLFCGKTYFFKQVFILNSSSSPWLLKQCWCDFPQASLVVLPIWLTKCTD